MTGQSRQIYRPSNSDVCMGLKMYIPEPQLKKLLFGIGTQCVQYTGGNIKNIIGSCFEIMSVPKSQWFDFHFIHFLIY